MSAGQNKALIQYLYEEGFNRGHLAIVDDIFSPDFIDRSTPDQSPGTQGVKDYISMVRIGFPDLTVTIEDLIATESRVVVRTSWRGTHLGEYEGVNATGILVTRTMIQIFSVEEGRLVEEWSEGAGLGERIIEGK